MTFSSEEKKLKLSSDLHLLLDSCWKGEIDFADHESNIEQDEILGNFVKMISDKVGREAFL